MAGFLYRVGRWIADHRLVVILVWVAAVVAVLVAVSRVGAETSNDLSLPGTNSQAATDVLADRFPPQQNGTNPIVFHVDEGTLSESDNTKAINQAAKAIQGMPDVYSAPSPFGDEGAAYLSQDEKTAFIPVLLTVSSADLDEEQSEEVLDAAEKPAEPLGIEVAAGGSIGSELSSPETESSELVGIVVAMIILSLAFGSIVAMGMPIISAVIGLIVGLTGIGLLGHLFGVPDIAPTLATMIGLGVGIDYALFLVSRHRAQLAEGTEMRESIGLAVATSGSAIVFAGGTVVIALICLAVAGIPLVSSLGYASAIAVLTAVLAAITLLPAVLSLVGGHISSVRLPAFLRPRQKDPHKTLWARWGHWVTRRPLIAIAAALVLLGVLIVPLFSLEFGQEDIGATPSDTTERQAFDLMSAGFGPGYNGPLLIATELGSPATASPQVQQQEDELNSLQAQLESEQAEGQQQQAALEAQAAELQAEQAELESEQAGLEAEAADLGRQAGALRAEQARVQAERARIEAEIAAIVGRRGELFRRAEAILQRARAARARRAALEAQLQRVLAAIEAAPPGADAAARQAEAQRLRGEIAAVRGQEREQLADAAALRRQAAQAGAVRPPENLRQQVRQLLSDEAELARNAASLEREKLSLEAQAAELQRQGAALQAEAADLQAQQAELEALQAQAQQQQKQAESLKNQLTQELTKAGGDARGTDPRLVKLQDALGAADGVDLVSPPEINESGNAAIYSVIATTQPAAPETADLVKELRSDVIPEATAGEDLQAYVGGSTASNVDLASEIQDRLLLVIGVVLALSFIVLMVAFRSLLVPLQAAVTNVLCVGAAFGVLTAAFQWGWGIDVLGVDTNSDTVPIASYVPLMMFAVLFGLSMDYQVFLLSAVAMRRQVGDDDKEAVSWGMAHSGPVITAAALIMIGVFGSFILNGDPTVKQFGVGLAVAVALAASMVLLLAPAVLTLMGRWTWSLPRWLSKAIPEVDIEGEGLLASRAAEGTLPEQQALAPKGPPASS